MSVNSVATGTFKMNNSASNIRDHFSGIDDDVLLSRAETAQILGCTTGTLANWVCNRNFELPVIMVGRLPKCRAGDIREYISRNRRGEIQPAKTNGAMVTWPID
jgi:hypothetical protein